MALIYLLELATTIVVALFLLRFLLQATRSDFRNPASQAIVRFTNPLVMPLRRVIPGWGRQDIASLVAALVLQAVGITLLALYMTSMRGGTMPSWSAVLLRTPLELALLTIKLYTVLVFLRVIMSWLQPDPRNPVVGLLHSLTEPLLRPARRIIPLLGGLDLSPILVLIALEVLRRFLAYDLVALLS